MQRVFLLIAMLTLLDLAGCNRLGGGAPDEENNNNNNGWNMPPPSNGHKRVFVTSTTYSGFLGGLSAADQLCQARANAGTLGGTWVAWMSDGQVDALSKINDVGPWFLADAVTIVFS